MIALVKSRKCYSYFHWLCTNFFKGLTRKHVVLCSLCPLGFYFHVIFFKVLVIFFANPLLEQELILLALLACIHSKIEKYKNIVILCVILKQCANSLFYLRSKENQQRPPLEQSHLSSTEWILVHRKTNMEPWS